LIQDEQRLELGAGDGVGDGGDFIAEVEALGLGVGWREQAQHAAADVGGAGEVGLVGVAGAAQGEDAGSRRDGAQEFGGGLGGEG